MKSYRILLFITAVSLVVSCGKKGNTEGKQEEKESFITITSEQFQAGNMLTGLPVEKEFREIVRCNGKVIVRPSGNAVISSPVPGIVSKIECSEGQEVNQGQILFVLSGNEFIDLQKDLAESANQFKRINSEYERMKRLYSDKVGSEKDMVLAESEYLAAFAKFSALRMKVKLLGLDNSRIEEGKFYDSFYLMAPIKGNVTALKISQGQYADPQTPLAQIIDITRIQLRLEVFEKDLQGLRAGQDIIFTLLGDDQRTYPAKLRSIGKNVDAESRTVLCNADIIDKGEGVFVNNAFAQVQVVTASDTVTAIPEEAIVKSGKDNFILEMARYENNIYYLRKVKAEIGRVSGGFAELLNMEKPGEIVIRGAYNLSLE